MLSSCFDVTYISFILMMKIDLFDTWTIRKLSPVSLAKFSRTFRHGFGDMSNDALKARRCCVFSMVRGRFGPRRPSTFDVYTSSVKYSSRIWNKNVRHSTVRISMRSCNLNKFIQPSETHGTYYHYSFSAFRLLFHNRFGKTTDFV